MKQFRTYIQHFVTLVVALQILNLSVYERYNEQNNPRHTIGEPNQIDSMIEYVAEIILNHQNAFPENGAHNRQSNSSHTLKHANFTLITFRKPSGIKRYGLISTINIPLKQEYKYLFAREIIPPPPKA
ncbi:MAG TPA: hypothetical protein VG738_07635 [Chitinophagaceae bacterium]|nr:hypothetical protein [Chitinophagaceae bacterium]